MKTEVIKSWLGFLLPFKQLICILLVSWKTNSKAVESIKQEAAGKKRSWNDQCNVSCQQLEFSAMLLSWLLTAWFNSWVAAWVDMATMENAINIWVVDMNGMFTLCVVYCRTCGSCCPIQLETSGIDSHFLESFGLNDSHDRHFNASPELCIFAYIWAIKHSMYWATEF